LDDYQQPNLAFLTLGNSQLPIWHPKPWLTGTIPINQIDSEFAPVLPVFDKIDVHCW